MLTESERRAAALAVIRYGVDRVRVKEAARAVERAKAEGRPAGVIETLVSERLLDAAQAEEIRLALGKTQIDLNRHPSLPTPQAAASATPGAETVKINGSEPRRLGQYQILRRLGEGGMGAVYLGYQEDTGRQVAIKVLSDQLAGNAAHVDRFKREARSVLYLDHPNIVRGFEVGEDKATGAPFLVLEYVNGPSAHALLDRFGRVPVGDAVHIVRDIARALEHAHSRNIIHRDIKPDNILITQSGVAKLADLGLARRTDENSQLTGARQSFGTPMYMPYEQAVNARAADTRSDIYALGATLYHLLTGDVPFPGMNPLEVAEKKHEGTFPRASTVNPDVPVALDHILDRMLATDPGQRYQTPSDLIVDLERSNLAAPVPSFIDPEIALQDPLVRHLLTTEPEPTRLNLGAAEAVPMPSAADPEIWYVRYRNGEGRWRKARVTTAQIRQRLTDGRLAPTVEAARDLHGEFRALGTYGEFEVNETLPAKRVKATALDMRPKDARRDGAQPKQANGLQRNHLVWLVPAGLILFLGVAALSYYLLS